MQRTLPTKKHETKVKLQDQYLPPDLLKPGEVQARRHTILERASEKKAGVLNSFQELTAFTLGLLTFPSPILGAGNLCSCP